MKRLIVFLTVLAPAAAFAAEPRVNSLDFPGPAWSQYLVGAGIGVLSWLTFYFADKAAFGGAGGLGAVLGAQGTGLVPPSVLLVIFAVLMLAVAASMWRRPHRATSQGAECKLGRCLAAGFGVGALTGFLGVGGGFLLVPALAYFALLSTPMAIGTSLAVIALNSIGGIVGHWQSAGKNWPLTALFLLAAIAGMLAGLPLAQRISGGALNRSFAVFVALVGLFVIGQTIFYPR